MEFTTLKNIYIHCLSEISIKPDILYLTTPFEGDRSQMPSGWAMGIPQLPRPHLFLLPALLTSKEATSQLPQSRFPHLHESLYLIGAPRLYQKKKLENNSDCHHGSLRVLKDD